MKNLIKVSTVSLVALTMILGSMSSALAGPKYKRNNSGYASVQTPTAPSNNVRQLSRRTQGGTQVTLPTKGETRVVKQEDDGKSWVDVAEQIAKGIYATVSRNPWEMRDVAVDGGDLLKDDLSENFCQNNPNQASCSWKPQTDDQGQQKQ